MESNEQDNTCRVVRVEPENADTTSVYITGYDDRFRQRRAGQYLTLKIMRDGAWSEAHPFTISCAPDDELLRVTIKRAGAFTQAVPNLKPGDPLRCAGPYGLFCKDIETRKDIVMIAGGVGITPFLSVLRHFRVAKAWNNILLFWSNKVLDDAFAREELKEMTRELDLRVVHNLSRETAVEPYEDRAYPGVSFMPGRLSLDLLKEHGVSAASSLYLCGPPPMQEFMLGELGKLYIDPHSVEKENFSW